ncbi:MAG: DUF2318 domain-containing protein [Dethiobacter sp.]|nr:DUF2318 domain-containing protein [Dethiobacter sp.]
MPKHTMSKKAQFTQKQKSRIPLFLGVAAAVVGLIVALVMQRQPGQANVEYFGEPVATPRSYIGRFISMTRVEPVIAEGQIKIPFDEVDRNNIVYFEAENDQGTLVPLMAYITPSGRLFAGSSMCEPCRGRTFSLAGETLVCDKCRTTYTIEDHRFISGAQICGSFAPVNMNAVIEEGMVVIDQQRVLNWRIRAL